MRWWISFTMSSNDRSSSRLAVTSLYSASMTARRSPSTLMGSPLLVLMVRMLSPEAFDGVRLVRVDLDEVLRAGHGQHRLDALLDARQLQVSAGGVDLTVKVHEAADGRPLDVGDGAQIDEHMLLAGRGQAADHGRDVGDDRIN